MSKPVSINSASTVAPFMRLAGGDAEADAGTELGTGAVTFTGFTPMNDQPGLADRKAMFVLAVTGMLLSTLFFFTPRLSALLKPQAVSLLTLAAILTVALLVATAARFAYAAYSLVARPTSKENVMFVQNVTAFEPDGFERELRSHSQEEALRLTLEYSHTMACLAVAKFRLVGRALACLRVALPVWMVLLLVLGTVYPRYSQGRGQGEGVKAPSTAR